MPRTQVGKRSVGLGDEGYFRHDRQGLSNDLPPSSCLLRRRGGVRMTPAFAMRSSVATRSTVMTARRLSAGWVGVWLLAGSGWCGGSAEAAESEPVAESSSSTPGFYAAAALDKDRFSVESDRAW